MASNLSTGQPPAVVRQRDIAVAARFLVLIGATAVANAAFARPTAPVPPVAPLYTEAAEQFLALYEEAGMLGAATVIADCYKRAAPKATERCIAFDSVAQVMTDSWAKNGFPAPLDSLRRPAFDARIKKQLRIQGIAENRLDGTIQRMLDQAAAVLMAETLRRQKQKLDK
jgi:D-alanyl-D-alanine dipeptidase